MHMRTMTFGFGLITGATAALSIPLFIDKMRLKKLAQDRENHESMKVGKKHDIKDRVIEEAMIISGKMKKEIDALVDSVNEFDTENLKVKGRKPLESLKKQAQSLKKMAD